MATMLIRNLPDRADEARLKEVLGPQRVKGIEFQDDPNPNTSKRQALVDLDMNAYEAEQLAKKYQGMILDGLELRVTVMHLMG